ncbi:hypothetical protein P7C71_g2206, partial [Lecanoromycetidae sp. Uapishka_2]
MLGNTRYFGLKGTRLNIAIGGAMITGGICFSYWLDFGFSFLDPSTIAWRFPIGFQIIFALAILLFVLELPESPRWLILKGKEDEAMSVLSALSDRSSDDPYIMGEFAAIKDTVLEMSQGGFADLFTTGEERHFHRTDNLGGKGPGIVAALFLFIFNTFFAIGWLGMTWLYPAEIVPLRIRAPANALSTSANWAFNFMVVMITPIAFASIGYKTYIIFAVINAFIFPVVYFFYPETAYRSLEEMDSIFRKCNSCFTIVKIARDEPKRYGKSGELLINYEETEEHQRRASAWSNPTEKAAVRNREHANPDYEAETGFGSKVEDKF